MERNPLESMGLVAAERLGDLHREAGQVDAARQTWAALRRRLESLDRGHPMLAPTVNTLAQLALGAADLVQAERLGRLALSACDEDGSRVHMMLSTALLAAQRPAEASAHTARALDPSPTEPPMLTAEIHFRHAEASYANGDSTTAVRSGSRAWAILEGPGAAEPRAQIQRWTAARGLTLEER
ncbi:MAG: hypothetical protein K0V04_19975 [Deltaproteobacteria bacterium]|nr:hypothetical protein [Deltaproteobacteria bacterium]